LAWSPKDDEVWFTADPAVTTIARRLMAVSLSGAVRLLAAAPGDLTLHDVSPDGTAVIAIDDRERKIFFTDSTNSPERELTWLDRAILVAISPDGKQVVFHEGGKGGGRLGTIFLRKTDGSAAVRLGEGYSVALSPDQKWVLAYTPESRPRNWLIPTGAGEAVELKPAEIENVVLTGFAPDSLRVIVFANEPGHPGRMFLFDPPSGKRQAITPEGVRGAMTADGKFLIVRADNKPVELWPIDPALPPREVKGMRPQERLIQLSDDGKVALIGAPQGLSATVYRLHIDTGQRQLVRRLDMHDPTGGFGITRAVATPDGQSFAFNTLRQLSELYLVQGLR
jgi:Tol biopolymer transport system component